MRDFPQKKIIQLKAPLLEAPINEFLCYGLHPEMHRISLEEPTSTRLYHSHHQERVRMPLEDLTYTCIRSYYPERREIFTFIMNNILVKDMTEEFAVVPLQPECGILLVVRYCDSF